MKTTSILIMLILCMCTTFAINTQIRYNYAPIKENKPKIKILKVKATYYNPNQNQCDSFPFRTASCDSIDIKKLKNHKIRWVACSRNLMKRYGGKLSFGDTIEVISNNKRISGKWIVKDLMNKRFKNKIDFLTYDKINGSLKNVCIKYEN